MRPARTAKIVAMLALAGPGGLSASATADPSGGASFSAAGPDAGRGGSAAQPSPSGGTSAQQQVGSGGLGVSPTPMFGVPVRFRGNLGPGAAHRMVLVERYSAARARWIQLARTRADRRGAFAARWRPDVTGRLSVRARAASGATPSAQASDGPMTTRLTVYRPALATWYGPGFYGQRTACGERLTRQMVGVANRTLPCGTLVEISYRGRTVTAPVIDRGPYSSASWDLTGAAAQALGFDGRDRIGTLIVGRSRSAPSNASSGTAPAPGAAARARRRRARR